MKKRTLFVTEESLVVDNRIDHGFMYK